MFRTSFPVLNFEQWFILLVCLVGSTSPSLNEIIHRHLGILFDRTFFHDVQGGHVQHLGSRYMVDSRLLFVSLTV